MALKIAQLNNLKAFFVALDYFKNDLSKIPPSMIIKGLPIKKEECLNLLRDLPGLKEKTNIELGELLKNQADRNRILGELLTGERIEIEKAIAENQKPATGEEIIGQPNGQEGAVAEQAPPAASGSGGTPMGGMPGIPSAPSISLPRVIRDFKIPHPSQPPKPDIAIANKSGVVAEKPPSEFHVAGKSGNITATYSKESLSAQAAQPKLVQARGDGSIIEPKPANPTIHITDKSSNVVKSYRVKSPGWLKTFGSNAQIFASKNLVRIGNGLWNMGKIGTGGAYNFGVKTGNRLLDAYGGISRSGPVAGSRSIVGKISRLGRGGGGGLSSVGKAVKKRGWLVFLLAILGFMMLVGGLAIIGTGQEGIIPPTGSSDISQCKFTRAGNSQFIKSSILAGWISSAAASVGIPASILASIAMHESPDFVANAENNHDAIKSNRYCSNGSPVCLRGGEKEHDGDCTENEIQTGLKTATAKGLMQLIDVYNPDMNEEDFCNIQKNILRGADTLKRKAGSSSLNNENDIKKAVCGYFGPGGTSCPYPGGDYAADAWTDYQNCQTQSRPSTPPGPVPTEKLKQIVYWAKIINDSLQKGLPPSSWNKMIADISNNGYSAYKRYALAGVGASERGIYWCTDIVIDAYNLAGASGLSVNHEGVLAMKSFFANTAGYQLLPPDTSVERLRPGDVIFFEGKGQHTSIVKSIEISQAGNGVIKTYESNNVVLEDIVYVQNYKATKAQTSANIYSITGFGQIKGS